MSKPCGWRLKYFAAEWFFDNVFSVKNNEMEDGYDTGARGNRGSLLTVILANILWTLKLQELVKQRVLWNVFASIFSRVVYVLCPKYSAELPTATILA